MTRDFHDTVRARAVADPEFARALFAEGARELLAGDVGTARALLSDYARATLDRAPDSDDDGDRERLLCLLDAGAVPSAGELVDAVASLQRRTGVTLDVVADAAE